MERKISALAAKYYKKVQAIRQELHMYPELACEEHQTQSVVERELDLLGIAHERMADTGVKAVIKMGNPGKTVLLRGDMDALPIQEEVDISYASKVPGKMHACGHDGHTAGLLGAAMILLELAPTLSGNVTLMFQPAEESHGGAQRMIEEGVLTEPTVDAAFGLHLWGATLEDTVAYKAGPMMGAPDEFVVTINGRGGHASMPQQTIDPVVLLMQVIQGFQNIVARTVDPFDAVVISTTQLEAGSARNIIPEKATAAGTVRTMNLATRAKVQKQMDAMIAGICGPAGATYTFTYKENYPPLINDQAMTEHVQNATTQLLGSNRVAEVPTPTLGGEDFAYLGYEVPSSFYYYGIATQEQIDTNMYPIHHHPKFAWNDSVLEGSMATLAMVAATYLEKNK